MVTDDGKDFSLSESDMERMPQSVSYEEEILIVINDENCKEVIPAFCYAIFQDIFYKCDKDIALQYMSELSDLLDRLPKPYTIVQEFHYIESVFRDAYYTFFSNQHFPLKRYSRRLSFFAKVLTREVLFSNNKKTHKQMSKFFMGACVLNPVITGLLGRTLIHPKYIVEFDFRPIYMRLSKFELNIYGKRFFIEAFPYRMQDKQTTSCVEVTLLNLLEYYANTYHDYRRVMTSEILESERKHSYERVLPSRGISYPVLTKVFSEFGFYPRLYNLSSIENFALSCITRQDELKRCLHYYIESGIPVALNLLSAKCNDPGHSIICIGHGKTNERLKKKAERKKWISYDNKGKCHPLINSADFYEDYVVIDDNNPVYQVRPFQQLSLYSDLRLENIAVPLYKRMFLDAFDAMATVRSVLHHEQYGMHVWADGFLKANEDVIIRLFMTSSRSFKQFRTRTLSNFYVRETYAMIPMPRFVWVCEFYRVKDYDKLRSFGEIVLDVTSAFRKTHSIVNLILMHYPGVIGVRYPDQESHQFDEMVRIKKDGLFKGYNNNLTEVGQ